MSTLKTVLAVLVAVVVTWAFTGVSPAAGQAPWRLVSGADGVLFVMRGDVKNRITPAAMTDEDLTVPEGPAWDDGVMMATGAASSTQPPAVARAAAQVPPPAQSSQVPPSAQSSGKRIGDTTVLTSPEGGRIAVTVNAMVDNVPNTRFDVAKGRWLVVDWTIKNEGSTEITVNRLHFKVQTAEGLVIERAGGTVREPALETARISPGQIIRGWLSYDVPTGMRVVSAIYQPSGSRQLVIADLT